MRTIGLLSGGAAALVWLLSPELHWAARLWLAALLAPLPALMIMQARQLASLEELPRRAAYGSSIISLWLLAVITALAAFLSDIPAPDLGLVGMPVPRVAAWTIGLTLAGVAVLFGFRFAGVREAPIMEKLLPADRGDRLWFAGVSFTAGTTEEFVFRGFLIHVLTVASGSVAIALILSSCAFGVVHAYQRPAGALRAGLLGALLALPLVLDGSILPAILAHVAIDLLSGLWLARYLLR